MSCPIPGDFSFTHIETGQLLLFVSANIGGESRASGPNV